MLENVKRLSADITNSVRFANNTQKATKLVKKIIFAIFVIIMLSGVSYVILSPLINILSGSIMLYSDKSNPLIYIIPKNFTWENYAYALQYLNYVPSLVFSVLYCFGLTILQVFICSMVGYGFARFNFPFRNVLFGFVILTIVVPMQTYMVPLYVQFRFFDGFGLFRLLGIAPINLLNTVFPMTILTAIGMGFRSGLYIYIFRQFFRGMPKEIEEAAFIDGAGKYFTYFRIMLPNAIPSVITVMLFSFVWQYNDTFFTDLFISNTKTVLSKNLSTIGTTFSYSYFTANNNMWPPAALTDSVVNAAVVLGILPIIIIYLLLQKYFIEGIERSGIVG